MKQKQNEGGSICETYIKHKASIRILEPENLGKFLAKFQYFAGTFAGDLDGKLGCSPWVLKLKSSFVENFWNRLLQRFPLE